MIKKLSLALLGLLLVIAAVVGASALFTVDQRAQAIVFQFGDPRRVVDEPGLYVKVPFIQNVVYYDRRVLDLDPPQDQVILQDKKRINVDVYARYRITDPLEYYQSVRTEAGLRDKAGKVLNSSVRNVLGRFGLPALLSEKRDDIMKEIQQVVASRITGFGIAIVDVRIGRTDLPEDISKNVYDRMSSERQQEANLLRAEGDELKQKITAEADRERTVILAEARKQSEILVGEGEAQRNRILADAYGKDQEFFRFYRSMLAYREAFGPDDTTMVLSPDSEFFRYFGQSVREKKTGPDRF